MSPLMLLYKKDHNQDNSTFSLVQLTDIPLTKKWQLPISETTHDVSEGCVTWLAVQCHLPFPHMTLRSVLATSVPRWLLRHLCLTHPCVSEQNVRHKSHFYTKIRHISDVWIYFKTTQYQYLSCPVINILNIKNNASEKTMIHIS